MPQCGLPSNLRSACWLNLGHTADVGTVHGLSPAWLVSLAEPSQAALAVRQCSGRLKYRRAALLLAKHTPCQCQSTSLAAWQPSAAAVHTHTWLGLLSSLFSVIFMHANPASSGLAAGASIDTPAHMRSLYMPAVHTMRYLCFAGSLAFHGIACTRWWHPMGWVINYKLVTRYPRLQGNKLHRRVWPPEATGCTGGPQCLSYEGSIQGYLGAWLVDSEACGWRQCAAVQYEWFQALCHGYL